MTKFVFDNSKNTIFVNALPLNRENVIKFLSFLFQKYATRQSFTIKMIHILLDAEKQKKQKNSLPIKVYTEKSIRAFIQIFKSMNFIEICSKKDTIPLEYKFKNLTLLDMVNHLQQMR